MRIKNLPSILSMDGSQDALVIEQTDGSEDKSRKVSPAQIKQYVLGNSIDDIYSVMGQNGAKNLLVPKWVETKTTENGVTYTFNDDGTIIMNTDASGATADTNCNLRNKDVTTNNLFPAGSYTLTGCPTGGSSATYRTWARAYRPNTNVALTDNMYEAGNGVSFTVSEPFSLGLNVTVMNGYVCNNLTWKPMLRLAADTDNTYKPYAKTNKQLTDDKAELESVRDYVNELGVKNLIPYPYYETTKTVNGVTFTDNGDGTITVSGTASADATFNIRNIWAASDIVELLPNTIYAFSGCPVGGGTSTYSIQFVNEESDMSNKSWYDDIGTGGTLTTTDVKRFVGSRIVIKSGTAFSTPVTFKPMLRLASDINDDTYVQFAKSNRQLTEVIGDLSQTGLTGDSVAAQLLNLNGVIDSQTGGKVSRYAVSVENNKSVQITFSTNYSAEAEFALVAFNIGGNALAGFALFALGMGNSKIKDLIGVMGSQQYEATFSTSPNRWTIKNKCGSTVKVTVMISKGSVEVI